MLIIQGLIQSRAANFEEISNKLVEKLENRLQIMLLKYFRILAL